MIFKKLFMMTLAATSAWLQNMTTSSRHLFHIFILALVAFTCFSPALLNGFVYDDMFVLINIEKVKSLNVFKIIEILFNGLEFCPLRDLTFVFDDIIGNGAAFTFHVTNIILYSVCVILVYLFFVEVQSFFAPASNKDCINISLTPFFAALLFAVHPIHTDVVASVFSRGAIMSAIFCFLSCIMFMRYMKGDNRRYLYFAISLFCYFSSLLSKQYGIILPLLLLLLISHAPSTLRKKHRLMTVPFFAISIFFYVFLKKVAMAANFIPHSADVINNIFSKLAVFPQIIVFYIPKLLFPREIVAEYYVDFPSTFANTHVLFSLVVIVFILLSAFLLRRKTPILFFGVLFYFIALIPFLNLLESYPIVADRYAFFPATGFFIILMAVPLKTYKKCGSLLLCTVVIWWGSVSFQQVKFYYNGITLWEHTAKIAPSAKAYNNLWDACLENRDYKKAEELMWIVRSIEPPDGRYDLMMGNMYFNSGDYDEAIRSYTTAMTIKENKPDESDNVKLELYNNLATAYRKVGKFEKALHIYNKCIELKPADAGFYNSLGSLYGEMNQHKKAVKYFEMAISLNDNYGFAPLNLAVTYHKMGDRANAVRYFNLVIKRFPYLKAEAQGLLNSM